MAETDAAASAYRQPKAHKLLWRGFVAACPACGGRKLFPKLFHMAEDCPRCGLHFERIEGHWIGAIGLNTVATFGSMFATMIGGVIATHPDTEPLPLTIVLVVMALGVPTVFWPSSRTMWTGLDIAMRPLEPHEVDWTRVRP